MNGYKKNHSSFLFISIEKFLLLQKHCLIQKSFKIMAKDTQLWEVFIRSRQGLDHKHVGSLHATDAKMALQNARDVYTRRMEGVSIWVVESSQIHASNPDESAQLFDPAQDKVYRHPTFYNVPDSITHM
jgi:ring-1,2-phenylacetyl-CoA epoxidase subunit PaaB